MDAVNREIIRILLDDGRATFHAIGRQVKLSAPAVKRRVDQMLARGEISGFTAVIDPASLGWNRGLHRALLRRQRPQARVGDQSLRDPPSRRSVERVR